MRLVGVSVCFGVVCYIFVILIVYPMDVFLSEISSYVYIVKFGYVMGEVVECFLVARVVFQLWIHIMDVYCISCWCRYLSHLNVELYSMVCGGVVVMMCISLYCFLS